ncbi:hypothetical protein PACTADRAFT_50941 [Pachysolen tannophilus NRRL Y-2460]|uniref:PFU domain-containing protein n=1 Tax=Pachysolen tannophilus NRRL Y-2460 TaxID=669874 RepID=A0A1E4TQK5_PACTA|nr:hypothetical protein PACTADRAFT_50941 [Pachysolen tannophilus NRRL Y-2460]
MDQFVLSATLKGHEQDVRSIKPVSDDMLVSCSRDSTVRVWNKLQNGDNINQWDGSVINYQSATHKFINSLTCFVKDKENFIASGGNEKLINVTSLFGTSSIDPKYVLIGHTNNVCSLDSIDEGLIISGSWDATAKVWDDFKLKYDLIGHENSVWDVKIIGTDLFLTCSADKTIKLWNQDKVVKTYKSHTDVVRSLLVLPDGETFASCSNDGTIKIWNISSGECLQTYNGHESFVYCLGILSNGDLVSSGEDRSVRIWRNGKCIQVIRFACISIWTVAVQNNDDIAVGGSDGLIRIFTKSKIRAASEKDQEFFLKEVENSSINEKSMDGLNKEKIPGKEALENSGEEGKTIMIKLPTGLVEAYQWSGGKWIKIGDVVGASGNDKKQEYNGKNWDYVFDVDVKEGEPPLKLAFNANENPYVVAANFLEKNDLPQSYTEEVVRFIMNNTQGVTLGESAAANPYADRNPVESIKLNVIPQTSKLSFEKLIDFKNIEKINSTEPKKYTEEQLNGLKESLNTKNYENLFKMWEFMFQNYNNKIIVYDFLRALANSIPQYKLKTEILPFLGDGLKSENLNIQNLALKVMTNIAKYIPPNQLATLFPLLRTLKFDNSKIALTLATLLYNLSIGSYNDEHSSIFLELLTKLIDSSKGSLDSEVGYRSLIAIGNLAYYGNLASKKYLKDKTFVWNTNRFTTLYNDFERI